MLSVLDNNGGFILFPLRKLDSQCEIRFLENRQLFPTYSEKGSSYEEIHAFSMHNSVSNAILFRGYKTEWL